MKGSKAVLFNEGEAIVNEGEKFQKVFQIVKGSCVVQRKMAGTDKIMTLSKMGVNGIFNCFVFSFFHCMLSCLFTLMTVKIFLERLASSWEREQQHLLLLRKEARKFVLWTVISLTCCYLPNLYLLLNFSSITFLLSIFSSFC
jgi:hypothetical protein